MNASIATESAIAYASCAVNHYRGHDGAPGMGFNVYLDGEWMIAGIRQDWAMKAVRLLNACVDQDEQRRELARIRAGIRARG